MTKKDVKTAPKTAQKAKTAPKKVVNKKEVSPPVVESVEPVVQETKPEVEEVSTLDNLSGEFVGFMTKLQQLGTFISTLKTEFRVLEKKAVRELRLAQKGLAKKKRKQGNRSPSGFTKPSLISQELAVFLDKPQGTEMARTAVTREINAYIREHSLQDKDNGRKINADPKLSTLLRLKKGDELTYFNLQRYMSPHFAKASNPIPEAEMNPAPVVV